MACWSPQRQVAGFNCLTYARFDVVNPTPPKQAQNTQNKIYGNPTSKTLKIEMMKSLAVNHPASSVASLNSPAVLVQPSLGHRPLVSGTSCPPFRVARRPRWVAQPVAKTRNREGQLRKLKNYLVPDHVLKSGEVK